MAENKICSSSEETIKLIFACSGGADVGHISDLAARQLAKEGFGTMYCLAGLGGKVEPILKHTDKADQILVIDGCSVDCAKKTMTDAGFNNFNHFQVTALDLDKGKSPATDENVQIAVDRGRTFFGI